MFPNLKRLYIDLWSLPKRHAGPFAPCTEEQLARIIAELKSYLEQKEGPDVTLSLRAAMFEGRTSPGLSEGFEGKCR
jgi:hypothetical protein